MKTEKLNSSGLNLKQTKEIEEIIMRKLATIRTVESVNPIEGADRIEYITMKDLGWKVVVGKGDVRSET